MRKLILYIFLVLSTSAIAGPVEEAQALYESGDYAAAIAKLQKAKARYPEANLILARIAMEQYRPSDAREAFDAYATALRKKKKSVPEEVEAEMSQSVMMENMLSRVEKIAVIDSMVVDADQFFKAYRISPEAGRLVEGEMVHLPDVEMAFVPQNNTQILYSEPDSLGNFTLMGADILDDGSVDHPMPLPGDNLNGGGNAEYSFLLSDGLTLYYANDGEESLGGYDIFLTRRNDDGDFLQPQNIGMPYNSPYDDYLLAIDETTGLGWWATDRNRIPGKVTIYVFVPSDTRVNVPSDDPNLTALALMSDIALTRQEGVAYPSVPAPNQFAASTGDKRPAKDSFALPISSTTKIYHKITDFRNAEARRAIGQAINARAQVSSIESRLTSLREAYGKGDRSKAFEIQNLEQELESARRDLRNYTNRAISLETNQ